MSDYMTRKEHLRIRKEDLKLIEQLKKQLQEARSCPKCPKCNETLDPYVLEDDFYGDSLNWYCGCAPRDLSIIEDKLKEKGE